MLAEGIGESGVGREGEGREGYIKLVLLSAVGKRREGGGEDRNVKANSRRRYIELE